jgi:cyanophycin synthetase
MSKNHLQILRVRHLRGPNIWTYRPVIEAWLDLGELEEKPSNKIPGFYERLTALLPGLMQHRCGVGEVGGFLERLRDGTWAGHILEHICLELQTLAGMATGFGQTRSTSHHGIYKMAFRTRQEEVGRAALDAGHALLMAAIEDRPFDVASTVARLRELNDRHYLGPSTAHIVDAAIDRRIPHIRLNEGNLVQLGYGVRQRRIWTAETDQTSAIAESIASDKQLTKELLSSAGVPVPEGEEVDSPEQAWRVAQDIGLPVTVKPTDANHGRGVFTDLRTREDIEKAWQAADAEGNGVLVEKFIEGDAHRLLVVGRRVVAATRGKMQTITGDGHSTVLQLIDAQINSDPRCGEAEEFPLEPLILDKEPISQLELARQGYTGESVPPPGQVVLIRRHGDLAYDVTDLVHLRETAKALGQEQGVKVTYMPFIMKATALALAKFPALNAHLDEASQEIVRYGYVNLGIAMDTDNGLIVPVVKEVQSKGILQLAAELNELADRTRQGKVKPEELKGSTFSITNAGNIGGILATPIINYPDVAILGVHRIVKRPGVVETPQGDKIEVRQYMNLSCSVDHRLADGADGARFLVYMKRLLENPGLLAL